MKLVGFTKQSDETWKRTISFLESSGDTYAIIQIEKLWSAQKIIEKLEKEIKLLKSKK